MALFFRNIGNSVLFSLNKTHILPKSFSSPFQICINQYSKSAKIYENLGLIQPPKKPTGAYFRFSKEMMSTDPSLGKSGAEKASTLGKRWKELSATQKQPYEDAYKKELAAYAKQAELYRRSLSEDQILAIKNERKRLEYERIAKQQQKERKKTMDSLGKPKKPWTGFFLFRKELASTNALAEVGEKWSKLPENEKNVYMKKAAELRTKYENELEAWEKQMISQGNDHLVRKKIAAAAAAAKKDDIQSVPNRSAVDVHAAGEIEQNIDEVIAKDERCLDSEKKEENVVINSQHENTHSPITDTKTTYIISKFKKFFKS